MCSCSDPNGGIFSPLSSDPPFCAQISQTRTFKINKLAPNVVVTITNRASVLLMDHIDNAGGISISEQ